MRGNFDHRAYVTINARINERIMRPVQVSRRSIGFLLIVSIIIAPPSSSSSSPPPSSSRPSCQHRSHTHAAAAPVATCVRSPWRTMAPLQQYIDTHAPCDRSSVRSHARSCVYHVVSAHNTSVLMHTNTGHRRTSYRTVALSVSAKHPILTHSHPPHPLSLVVIFARTVNT